MGDQALELSQYSLLLDDYTIARLGFLHIFVVSSVNGLGAIMQGSL